MTEHKLMLWTFLDELNQRPSKLAITGVHSKSRKSGEFVDFEKSDPA